jgi:hypothetical protein
VVVTLVTFEAGVTASYLKVNPVTIVQSRSSANGKYNARFVFEPISAII